MNKKEIRHFKLTSGEEVICEVVEWDSEDSSSIIIRAAMLLVENISIKSGVKIFSFRPWLSFQEDPELLHTINAVHIVGETFPSKQLLQMYKKCLIKLNNYLKENNDIPPIDLDEFDDMTDDELHDLLEDSMKNIIRDSDEDTNVIPFRKKDETFH
jgi:hypothetical protein